MALSKAQERNAERNRQYWAEREEAALTKYKKSEAEYDKEIKRIYSDMLDSVQTQINDFYGRYAAKEGITLAEAKKRVKSLDIAKYERKAAKYVKDKDFSDKANEEMRLYNATMKINRLEMLKANIGLETIAGHNELEKFMSKILQGRTEEELKRQAGILGKTIRNNAQLAHAIPNASFHNATFSDRIWQYQDLMRADLSKMLETGLIQGKNPRAIAKDLRKYWYGNDPRTGGGATYCMERLMRTELARVQTEAQKQSFEQNGFTQYTFIANSDCCDICKEKDGKHFKVKDMMPGENAAPLHPHCRCSVAAYEDSKAYDEWLDFLANGGTTAEWEKLKAAKDKPQFKEIKDAIDFQYGDYTKEDYNKWWDEYEAHNKGVSLSAEELKIIEDYTEGSFIGLNDVCRYSEAELLKKGYSLDDIARLRKKAELLDGALSKYDLDTDIVTHRFERNVSWLTGKGNDIADLEALIGSEYTAKGFTSSGMLANRFRFTGGKSDAVHFEIVTPKGTDGAFLSMSKKGENEFLYNRNTKFRVLDGGERVVKEMKYDFKTGELKQVDVKERFLRVQVIPDTATSKQVLTKTVKSGTMPSNKYGFKYIKGEHTREADLAATNPNYKTGREWQVNCQRCVSAYEARRRGYDVEAKPAILNSVDRMPYMFDKKEGWTSVYDGIKPINCASSRTAGVKKKVEETMSSFGDGARAIVRVQWQKKYGGGGHVFIAEQVDGSTIFIDPQPNKTDVGYYFSMAKTKETYVLRIDDLEFTDNIQKCCENVK